MGSVSAVARAWVLFALGVFPLVPGSNLGQVFIEQGEIQGEEAEGARVGGTLASPTNQVSTSAPAPEVTAKLERIVNPTLGPFNPSPEVKFPEPPVLPPVYGEMKTPSVFGDANTGLSDVLTPPHHYYAKHAMGYAYEPPSFSDRLPPVRGPGPLQVLKHHAVSLPPLLVHGHGGKDEGVFLAYDGEDEVSYQYLPPGHPSGPAAPFPHPHKNRHPPVSSPGKETDAVPKESGKAKAWKTLVAALTTLVPIGLFLAALPPNYVTVQNATSARVGKETRAAADGEWDGRLLEEEGEVGRGRLLEDGVEYPMLGLMGRYGLAALGDPECESRIFCEMSRMGKDSGGNLVQRVFWSVVNDVPDMLTEIIGLKKLFKAARTDSCRTFKCKNTRDVGDD